MNPDAQRDALALIAREYVLTRRDLLDAIGRPLRLAAAAEPDIDRLHAVALAVFASLPEDIAAPFPDLIDRSSGRIAGLDRETGIIFHFTELQDPSGEPWVGFLCGLLHADADEAVGAVPENVNVLVNQLNLHDHGAAWVSMDVAGTKMLVRLSAAAAPIDEGVNTWAHLAAHLLAQTIAASEPIGGDEPMTPARTYLDLLALGHAGDTEGYTPAGLRHAALSFRSAFEEDTARVVILEAIESGVEVSVPFSADSEVHALTARFEASGHSEDHAAGVRIFSRMYVNMSTRDAYTWSRSFNGDDDVPSDAIEEWDQTTPWLLGAWQTIEVAANESVVFYRGYVPDILRRYVSDEELIRGVIREIWVSANRYRLRREFEGTVGAEYGNLQ